MKAPLRRADALHLRSAVGPLFDVVPGSERRVCLVVDADRTLAPQDTGRLVGRRLGVDGAIRATFEAHGYCEDAFSKVASVWGEIPPERYLGAIRDIAAEVTVYAAWRTILDGTRGRAPVIVVTAGIPQVWRHVLDAMGYGDVPVVGGCHHELDAYVVCPEVKRDIVALLRAAGWTVVAAGDSPIDLEMLAASDRALFVADHKGSPGLRSHLHRVSGVRQLAVDAQRFEGVPWCTAEAAVHMIRSGGDWDAA